LEISQQCKETQAEREARIRRKILLEQHIARLESSQADPQVDPNEEDQQSIQDALDDGKGILENQGRRRRSYSRSL
jgi:hypothetical protein